MLVGEAEPRTKKKSRAFRKLGDHGGVESCHRLQGGTLNLDPHGWHQMSAIYADWTLKGYPERGFWEPRRRDP